MTAVMQHHDGNLDDDATVLLTEWRGGHQGELTPVNHPEAATGGATRGNQRPALRGSAPLSSESPRVGGIASGCG
ncbi:hypothetical protein [Streptomyces nigra]|uniref:hypothetical protein n=1 Tax=Streptomyces nigra TaxID=1827580 RepID=UPI0030D24F8F